MRPKTIFRCNQCERESSQWLGQCPSCEAWNSFAPLTLSIAEGKQRQSTAAKKERLSALAIEPFDDSHQAHSGGRRWSTGFGQFDGCLGGGLLESSLLLIGGAPGIGKSTLVSHMAGHLAAAGATVFYTSGEEDVGQISSRLSRLGIVSSTKLLLGSSLTLEDILWKAEEIKPDHLIVDSVQTISAENLDYPVGSPALIRSVTARLLALAKQKKISVVLLGHVTKEGMLAGPKHLEHMVDVVVQMEKPRAEEFRIVRVTKNRFGPANTLVVFEMNQAGLREVIDPSASFLSENWRARLKEESRRVGLASSFALDAGQAFLIQVEALVGHKKLFPGRRAALGVDPGRLQVLLAVLERALGISLESTDVFLSLVGGIKVRDPGIDLALVMALASVISENGIPTDFAYLGEVSLSGDVLAPRDLELRIRQAKALGFSKIHYAREGSWRVKDFVAQLKGGI